LSYCFFVQRKQLGAMNNQMRFDRGHGTQAAFVNANPYSWQPVRGRIESFDEHPHRHLPDVSVIRRAARDASWSRWKSLLEQL
jgi:hypothetical protein